jgi:hypothetical protein
MQALGGTGKVGMLACPSGTTSSKLLLEHHILGSQDGPDLCSHPWVFPSRTHIHTSLSLPSLPVLLGFSRAADLVPNLGL